MTNLSDTYRGCNVNIEISELESAWAITISVAPLEGVELIHPFENRSFKLPREESLDLIVEELLREVRLAIDLDIVDP